MNLDEMLAASGITGGAKAENTRTKTGFVTFIGRPNVGKSTLMNQIIGQKIAITSNKPQTTRNRIQTVYTDERGQIVFVDTPGIHKAKNKLGEYMVGAAEKTISEVDLICWLVEPTTHLGAAEEHIVDLRSFLRSDQHNKETFFQIGVCLRLLCFCCIRIYSFSILWCRKNATRIECNLFNSISLLFHL